MAIKLSDENRTLLWWLGQMGSSFVIPGHWDMFADNSEDPMKFADYISVKYPYGPKCILPKVMEELAL
jgi:hypothetical protein